MIYTQIVLPVFEIILQEKKKTKYIKETNNTIYFQNLKDFIQNKERPLKYYLR